MLLIVENFYILIICSISYKNFEKSAKVIFYFLLFNYLQLFLIVLLTLQSEHTHTQRKTKSALKCQKEAIAS